MNANGTPEFSTMATEPTPEPPPAAPMNPAQVAADILAAAAKAMPKPEAAPVPEPAATPAAETAEPILTDKSGAAFDPKRHKVHADGSPFVNARGYFMPIGGRKPKSDPAATVGGASAPVSATAVLPAPPSDPAADAAAKTAWGDADRKAANETAGPADASGADAEKTAGAPETDRGRDAELSPEYGGELCARSLYLLTGAATGDHKTAAATGAEHTNLVKMFTAFLRYRGFTVTGWGALGLSALAYLIEEKRRASVWAKVSGWCAGWFPKSPKPERRAEHVAAPDVAPAPAPVEVVPPAPPVSASAGPTAPSGPWADRVRSLSR